MEYEEYQKAQKMGLKCFKQNASRGQYPYLPVLDEILSQVKIECEENLGIIDIPLKQVIGTATAGRTQSFAANFMPLHSYGSEFALKWARLVEAQINEGIRDPIKVYEYMNRYYVIEGNKRVSVLKYMNCPTITAEVIRKVLARTDDIENQIYYEFMQFYRSSRINYVIFTKLGSYVKLCEAVGKSIDDPWTDDERMDFSSFHVSFYGAYKALGGLKFDTITDDDAMLFYLALYPYEEAREKLTSQIRSELEKMWSEIEVLGTPEPVELQLTPATETSMFKKMAAPKVRKVAFLYDVAPEDSDWIYGHELGRLHVEQVFQGAIQTAMFVAKPDQEEQALMERLCEEGYDILFAVCPMFIPACIKVAAKYPQVKILNCSLNSAHSSVRTYAARIYEGKFLLGILAGILAGDKDVGYISDYPIYGVIPGINAFATGVQAVNPSCKVHIQWCTETENDFEEYFREHDIHFISSQNLISPNKETKAFGLYHLHANGPHNIATTLYHWGVFYQELINSVTSGSWKSGDSKAPHAVNYWWGFSAGVLDIICGNAVPDATRNLVTFLQESITAGTFSPFYGPMYDQEGTLRAEAGHPMMPEEIMTMDWLADNIIGHIPTMDQLTPHAQELVALRGLAQTSEKGETSIL